MEVNNKYLEFLAIAGQYPKLGLTEHSTEEPNSNLDQNQKVQHSILYDLLTSIFDGHTCYMYKTKARALKSGELGISGSMDTSKRKSYVDYLRTYSLNGCFDLDFGAYLSKKITQFEKRSVKTAINQKEEV